MTDVSLGITVVNDACKAHGNDFDIACLVSNDSDMIPVFQLMKELHKRLLWVSPLPAMESLDGSHARTNKELEEIVPLDDQVMTGFTVEELTASQLPEMVGKIKPPDHEGCGIKKA